MWASVVEKKKQDLLCITDNAQVQLEIAKH